MLTQAGDLVISGVGAFPAFVLAEGDYTVVARHSGRQFQRLVTVRSGEDCDVEVLAAGDEALTLAPSVLVNVEMKASQKKDKEKFALEISWKKHKEVEGGFADVGE